MNEIVARKSSSPRVVASPRRPVIVALVSVSLLVAFFLGRAPWLGAPTAPPPAERIEVRPSPNVLVAVRELHRLETASFHMERVVEMSDEQTKLFGLLDVKDAILLVAVGEVTAGVDLDAIGPDDVEVDWAKRRARVRLPAPQIFSTTIDNARTHVVQRKTDTFADRNEQLEGLARQNAEESMSRGATEAGILDRAKGGAVHALEALLHGLGFSEVAIDWKG